MQEALVKNLNTAQLEAVASTEGPMMIIAGAGTGKTRVITSRILYLLLVKKIPASQILALTFTEKAADEMLERVDSAMPLSYEGATIKTFHSFFDQILKEKGIEIGIDPSYKLLNQAKQWLFIKNNLFEFNLDYYRPLGNPNKFINILLNHFNRLCDEYIKPDDYIAFAHSLNGNAGDADMENAKKILEAANAYKKYQDLLISGNCMDFSNLQFFTLKMLEEHPSVLKELQNRYKYILVDEYQDTNFAQSRFVTMLAKDHSNLVVVGDDDQSIYKWRGASLANLVSFEHQFPGLKKVVLNENYRSSQKILDLSYEVIRNNDPDRLEHKANIDKKLISKTDCMDSPVELWHFKHYTHEVDRIITKIKNLLHEGVNEGDIAILLRANQHASMFVNRLKDENIPFTVRNVDSITRFEEIKDLVALLKCVVKPHDNTSFVRLLSLSVFNIPMSLILDLLQKAKDDNYKPLFYYLKNTVKTSNQPSLPDIDLETDNLYKAFDKIDNILNFSRNNSIARILGEFLDISGYFKDLSGDSDSNADKLQRIAHFFELTHDFETENNDNDIMNFLDYLGSLEESGGLNFNSEVGDKYAVNILTVHSAKGLEFDYVFIPSLVEQRFPSTNRKDPIEIPSQLLNEEVPEADTNTNEERRLFYVACTRAKKGLYLSYSDAYEGNKKWKISRFALEAQKSGIINVTDFVNGDASESVDRRIHAGLEKIRLKEKRSTYEQKFYSPYSVDVNNLSYSKAETFTACPLKYKFRYLFNIPAPIPHAANFGSSIHETVNLFYLKLKEGLKPSMQLLEDIYNNCWIGGGYDSKAHENARKKQGLEMLHNFYKTEENHGFQIPAFMERNFRLKIDNITFSGRIDRIDKLGDGTFEVIDYKTGKSKRDINLKNDMQLSLYALACRDVFKIPVSLLSFYYLDDAVKASTTRFDDDLEKLKEELISFSKDLGTSEFLPAPGFHCRFCEYRVLCNAAEKTL